MTFAHLAIRPAPTVAITSPAEDATTGRAVQVHLPTERVGMTRARLAGKGLRIGFAPPPGTTVVRVNVFRLEAERTGMDLFADCERLTEVDVSVLEH